MGCALFCLLHTKIPHMFFHSLNGISINVQCWKKQTIEGDFWLVEYIIVTPNWTQALNVFFTLNISLFKWVSEIVCLTI